MRTNKMVLDEAARSVRRTFIVSTVGTVVMMAVIAAAGAYGMPQQLNAQSLSKALTTLQVKFSPVIEHTVRMAERGKALAESSTSAAASAMPIPDRASAPVPPKTAATMVAAVAAMPAAVVERSPAVEASSEVAAKPSRPALPMPRVLVRPFEPEPVATAGQNVAWPAQLNGAVDRAELTTPPFEASPAITTASLPDPAGLDEAQIVEVPAATDPAIRAGKSSPVSEPAAKTTPAVPQEIQNTVETPKQVTIALPRPKPPLTPAQRLGLHDKDYDRAEKCLAQAVYFEARNEPARGQEAVAQVVLNRVFSPYYPKDVCSVVYQNAHRYLSCQFTFACDGKSEAIRERGAWARATRIAKQTLEAKIWLPEVAKATHYHAAYVHPRWVRDMRVMVRYGLHTFYRPRNWGDGSHEPKWGAGAVKKPRAEANSARHESGHTHAPAHSIRTRYWSRLRAARL